MSEKIGADGKPYDPAMKAAKALTALRAFFERREIDRSDRTILGEGLNAIADRLQTCDALEHKIERQDQVHEPLVREATAMIAFIRALAVRDVPAPTERLLQHMRDIEDALVGIKAVRKLRG